MPSVFLATSSTFVGAGEQQDLLRLLRLGDPHLPPVDAVVVAVARGEGRDAGGVQAGAGLGHAEADVQRAVDDPRQRAPLQLVGAVLDHRVHAEDRQVDRAGRVHAAAGLRDLLDQDRRLGDPEPVPAVLLGGRDAQPAARGEGVVELGGELLVPVLLHPVPVVERARPGRRPPRGSSPGRR